MYYKFALIGGDKRSIYLAEILTKNGHTVIMYGFDKNGIINKMSLEDTLNFADYIICGIPFTRDNVSLNTPLSSEKILLKTLLKLTPSNKLIFTGALHKSLDEIPYLIDIYKTDNVTKYSTIATVEGALKIAIESTNITLYQSNILVIGYGNIGSYLSKKLSDLGASVTVISRSSDSIKQALDDTFNAYSFFELDRHLKNKSIIINTAPTTQIDKDNINLIDDKCVYIELASKPFGINYEDSVNSSLKVIYGLSLPGIVSPKTISNVLFEEIINYIKEMTK